MNEKIVYTALDLEVDFYEQILTTELANTLYTYLDILLPAEKNRSNTLFGDPCVIYKSGYRQNGTEVIDWDLLPGLPDLKKLVEEITEQKYNVCAINRYPNGKIGILPHQDREMGIRRQIAGLSLGATRTIEFTRTNHEPIKISLNSGSLYVMKGLTNKKWLHSIIKESKIKDTRFSLTFRDYV